MNFQAAKPQVWIKTRIVRCPKCSRSPIKYLEFAQVSSSFDAKPGFRDAEGWHEVGDITGVDAVCACGHRWRLRGVATIASLDLPPDQQDPAP